LYLDTFLVASILAAFIIGAIIGHEQQLLSGIFTLAVTMIELFASKRDEIARKIDTSIRIILVLSRLILAIFSFNNS